MRIQDPFRAPRCVLRVLGLCLLHSAFCLPVAAQPTAFTYQGQLGDNGVPASGFFDIACSVWTNASGPAQVGGTLTNTAVAVSNGFFTVTLDFGMGVFDGPDRWLEIGVVTNGAGAFTTLIPRQQITATPYAMTAASAGNAATADTVTGSVAAAQLTGAVSSSQLADDSVTSAKIADGTIVTVDLANNAVTSAQIAANTITAADLAADSVGSSEIAANAVGTSEIANGSVTEPKLAFSSVGVSQLDTNSIDPRYVNVAGDTMTGALVLPQGGLRVGSQALVVNSNGLVGIGTAAPMARLDVHQSGGTTLYVENTGVGSAEGIRANTFSSNGKAIVGTASGGGNQTAVYGETAGTDGWAGYFVGRGYFLDDVGIGTENPTAQLDVRQNGGTGLYVEQTGAGSVEGIRANTFSPSGKAIVGTASGGGNQTAIYGETEGTSTGWAGYFSGRGYFAGDVGIGTESPSSALDVNGTVSTTRLLADSGTVSAPGLAFNGDADTGIHRPGANTLVIATGGSEQLRIDSSGNVGIGTAGHSIDGRLHVQADNARAAKFDRYTSDGELVAWARDDSVVGNVTVALGVVSYNAFTGSHYAWCDEEPGPGTLMTLTGANRHLLSQDSGEIVYGIAPSAVANDTACLGSYVSTTTAGASDGAREVRLVAAVGNGDIWVIDTGKDIRPGDLLISADVAGCAMRDDPARFRVGNVVARAAEAVEWSKVEEARGGVRRAKISVLFEPFTRGPLEAGSQTALAAIQGLNEKLEGRSKQAESQIGELKAENAELKQRLGALEKLINRQAVAQISTAKQ